MTLEEMATMYDPKKHLLTFTADTARLSDKCGNIITTCKDDRCAVLAMERQKEILPIIWK